MYNLVLQVILIVHVHVDDVDDVGLLSIAGNSIQTRFPYQRADDNYC